MIIMSVIIGVDHHPKCLHAQPVSHNTAVTGNCTDKAWPIVQYKSINTTMMMVCHESHLIVMQKSTAVLVNFTLQVLDALLRDKQSSQSPDIPKVTCTATQSLNTCWLTMFALAAVT